MMVIELMLVLELQYAAYVIVIGSSTIVSGATSVCRPNVLNHGFGCLILVYLSFGLIGYRAHK